jgi:hypothetical protein
MESVSVSICPGVRFLVGMLEAPVFAGTHFILGEFNKYIIVWTILTQRQVLLASQPRNEGHKSGERW